MAAITGAGKNVLRAGQYPVAEFMSLDVAASTTLLPGALIDKDQSGNAKNATADTTHRVLGVFLGPSKIDNSAGAAGDLKVKIHRGVFGFANSSSTGAITKADLGQKAYVVDNQTVSRTDGGVARPVAGIVVGLEGSTVLVEVGAPDPEPFDLRVLAGADLTAKQFFYVKLNSSGKVVVCGAGESAIGVLQNTPNSDEVAIVRTFGPTRVIASGSITNGAQIASDGSGKAKAVVKASVNTSDAGASADAVVSSHCLGDALEAGTTDTAFATFFRPMGAVPTTAA